MVDPQLELDLVRFTADDRSTEFGLELSAETLWASAEEITELFHASTAAVAKQVAVIYADRELTPEETKRLMPTRGSEGSQRGAVAHHNLDLIRRPRDAGRAQAEYARFILAANTRARSKLRRS